MTDRIDSYLPALLRGFRRQRPLRSGSLLMTILGDSIAPRGGAITLGSLIRLAEPFGLPERLVRTSVARLAKEGWLTAHRSGRNSEYQLSAQGRKSFAAATRRIYGARSHDWNGRWTLVLIGAVATSAARNSREALRERLRWLGFGQFTADAWGHPGECSKALRASLTEAGIGEQALLMQAVAARSGDERRLVAAAWNLTALGRAYGRFVASFKPLSEALQSQCIPSPATAFIVRTLLIHEYRKIHLRDPLLPDALLPRDWIGAQAYDLCRELYRNVFAAAEQHLTARAHTLAGALPRVSREGRRRFAASPG